MKKWAAFLNKKSTKQGDKADSNAVVANNSPCDNGNNCANTVAKAPKPKQSVANIVLTVIGALLCAILLPICIVNVTLAIKGAVNPKEVPDIFGYSPLIVLSGSMENTIYTDDLIFVKKIDPTTLKEQDIIAFNTGNGDEVVTHRIVGLTEENGKLAFLTKGDFILNSQDKNPVPSDKVVGLYKSRIPKVGKFMMFLQKPYGMAIVVGVPVVLYIAYYFINKQVLAKKAATADVQTAITVTETALDELATARAEIEKLKKLADAAKGKNDAEIAAEQPNKRTQAPSGAEIATAEVIGLRTSDNNNSEIATANSPIDAQPQQDEK